MAPTTNELETLSQTSTESVPADAANPQPTAAEVPVTVNGARTVAGSDKREPFSENTQTVLVFAKGAVIRLSSPVTPGQLLFLTNEKTKKEVVCQVTKSKAYSSASGYVELQFTEASPGFWGLRIPSNPGLSSAVKSLTPVAEFPSKLGETRETRTAVPSAAVPATVAAAKRAAAAPVQAAPDQVPFAAPQPPAISSGKAAEEQPTPVAHEQSSVTTSKMPTLSEFLSKRESGPELRTPEKPKAAVAAGSALEDIKNLQRALRKQSQPEESNSLTNLLVPAAARENPAPGSSSFDFGADEVKIPAWLEPLARNASPVSAATDTKAAVVPEPEEKIAELSSTAFESAGTSALQANRNEADLELSSLDAAASEDRDSVLSISANGPSPNFGSSLALDKDSGADASQGSGAGIKSGLLAAALLLAAGGGWYWYSNQPKGVSARSSSNAAGEINAAVNTGTIAERPGVEPLSTTKSGLLTPAAVDASRNAGNLKNLRDENREPGSAATSSKSVPGESNLAQPASPLSGSLQPPAKKSSLGDVHLAAPKISRHGDDNAADAAPALGNESLAGSFAPSANLLSGNSKQPSAPAVPLPVGGAVNAARLISSMAPTYPQMARNQRVSGDVRIDALVDANGRVSAMNVIAGPALLHQAAIDAVRQWKYQPATLNGKPVPMHLTVTVQFKLQ